MKAMFKSVMAVLGRLHRCEQGAEGAEKLLIVAAIVLPLLGLLIVFRDTISEWLQSAWDDTTNDAAYTPPNLNQP